MGYEHLSPIQFKEMMASGQMPAAATMPSQVVIPLDLHMLSLLEDRVWLVLRFN